MTQNRKAELRENLSHVENQISQALFDAGRNRDDLTLVVVTKTYPVEDALFLYELGVRDFGENRDHEGALKAPALPNDARWHFQGQIQSRKISSISSWSSVVHSLDSLEHAAKFSQRADSSVTDFFLQVSMEPSLEHRGGIPVDEIDDFLARSPLHISGLMVVPPLEKKASEVFSVLAQEAIHRGLPFLSMGMSGDFVEAIKAGATHIRVGSSILGSRPPLT